jgi:DNA topoisomerase VI subunit A
MMIEETVERIKLLQLKIDRTLVIEKAAAYQQEIDELIDEANRLSIDLTEYITEHE